ncbi:MAG: class I SAM-dependent methyltransferase [Micavibrio sp.]|nr:MAG: class I SAM-dependent methyltransferase [Micavibrio sp.]
MKNLLARALEKRARHNFSFIADYVEGDKIIDIGAAEGWNGRLAKQAGENRDVRLLDVADMNRTDLPLTLYDGKAIPFADETFDTALLLLVLHHCSDPDTVLREAARVTRRRLIVTESVYRTKPGRHVLWCLDNALNGLRSGNLMPEGLHFRTTAEWIETFGRHGLLLRKTEYISKTLHKHILFVLDKQETK